MAEGAALAEQDEYLHPNGQSTSEAAFELHVTATARSAVYDRPGFIPAGELAVVSGRALGYPGADLAGLAAELCAALVWKAAEGGWRVLDADAVEVCAARVRELRGEPEPLPGRPPARERPPARTTTEGIGRFGEPTARGGAASFRCARCGEVAGVVRVTRAGAPGDAGAPPGREAPREGGGLAMDCFLGGHHRTADRGVLDAARALIDRGSVDPAAIRELDWGFWALTPFYCPDCGLNYCAADWDISRAEDGGFREPAMGRCPAGHEHMVDENLTPDPERAPRRIVRMDRSWSFDGEDHVLSAAAYDLHLKAIFDSAREDRPGFVPDAYLDGLGADTAMVAELVDSRCWERADGGYRVRDWVEVEWWVGRVAERRRRAARNAWISVRTEQEEVLKNAEEARRDR